MQDAGFIAFGVFVLLLLASATIWGVRMYTRTALRSLLCVAMATGMLLGAVVSFAAWPMWTGPGQHWARWPCLIGALIATALSYALLTAAVCLALFFEYEDIAALSRAWREAKPGLRRILVGWVPPDFSPANTRSRINRGRGAMWAAACLVGALLLGLTFDVPPRYAWLRLAMAAFLGLWPALVLVLSLVMGQPNVGKASEHEDARW